MIRLNFIPSQNRKERMAIIGEDFGGVPGEVVIGWVIALVGILMLMHALLAGMAVYKLTSHKIFEARWNAMAGDKKACDSVADELKVLQAKMNSLRPITSIPRLKWAVILNDISDSVPKGVWLRELLFEKDGMIILGSSVSKMKTEMVETGNFVAALREKPEIRDNFVSVDIDSIQSRENVAVSIADFSLKAKRK